jgi:hypothetical protein
VRDSNEASWTQVLEVVEFMADATDIPILLDADTGYGNFNNARRLVRKLEDRGIAGMKLTKLLLLHFHIALSGLLRLALPLGYHKRLYTAKLMYVHYFFIVQEQFHSHWDHHAAAQLQCFLHEKSLNGPLKISFLKGKTTSVF